jgi:multicomponent Na+:H+ antiporter subunit G
MTAVLLQILTVLLALTGAAFFLAGTLGLLRLPDCYSRIHAVTKCDAVGAGAILLALATHVGVAPEALKILVLLGLVLLSSPTSGHALARAAWRTRLEPGTGSGKEAA